MADVARLGLGRACSHACLNVHARHSRLCQVMWRRGCGRGQERCRGLLEDRDLNLNLNRGQERCRGLLEDRNSQAAQKLMTLIRLKHLSVSAPRALGFRVYV